MLAFLYHHYITMIIKKETVGGIPVYHVSKNFDDDVMTRRMNTYVEKSDIKDVIEDDADVYTEDGKLLLRFRKGALPQKKTEMFYDNVVDFAKNVSSNRGNATGSEKRNVRENPKVMSNIFGYFDRWSPSQKVIFRNAGIKPIVDVRECRFNRDYPDKYKKTIPLIQEIDKLYKKLTPAHYKAQRKKANQTYFKIPGTSFTTITTNINFQTTIHCDKGDDAEGFGNLAVIEHGKYTGAETCFPQYGIGVNVRSGDVLFMDVHQPHGNLPMNKKTDETTRLSIVCYLRNNVWLRTKNKTRRMFNKHNKTMKNLGAKAK
jgi:hypothetical protein